ncbi:MAG: beta-ketoacyl synthase N-terminal-like domain-containing protein [Candidatus Limnocylindria bacterium]
MSYRRPDRRLAIDFLSARRARRLDRYGQLAVSAAAMAVEDAGQRVPIDSGRWGVFIGSALGGVAFAEEQHSRYLSGGPRAASPILATTVYVCETLELSGPTDNSGSLNGSVSSRHIGLLAGLAVGRLRRFVTSPTTSGGTHRAG